MPLLHDPNALMAWGVLDANETPDRLATKIVGGTVRLNVFENPDTAEADNASTLAEAWRSVSRSHEPGEHEVGIRAIVEMDPTLDRDGIVKSILKADGVGSIYCVDHHLTDRDDFHWPLRVAYGSNEQVKKAIKSYHHTHLIKDQGIAGSRRRYDLLLLSKRDLPKIHREKVGAGLVVYFVQEPKDTTLAAAVSVTKVLEASAVFVTALPEKLDVFVRELLDQISHNLPMDVACAKAARELGIPEGGWVMIGLPSYVESARVTLPAARMRAAAEDLLDAGRLNASGFVKVMGNLGHIAMMGEPNFYSESGGATEIVARTAAAEPILSKAERTFRGREEAPPASIRQLQAQVFVRAGTGLQQRTKSFESGTEHTINMRIGRSHLDWVGVKVPFPYAMLPANERFHELEIHLVAPGLFKGEQCKSIILGQGAESTIADFDVMVPHELEKVSIAVSVWRGTTHLQSALLDGPVIAGDKEADGEVIRFATGDRSAVDLDQKGEASISFIHQAGQLWMKRKGDRRLIDLPDVNSAVKSIRSALFEGAKIVNDLGIKLSDEDALPMLRKLVAQGEFIRRKLFPGEALDDVTTIEVTSAHSGEFLPVEFFYDYLVPDKEATLCSAFGSSNGRTCNGCEAKVDPKKICPSGFWGVRKIIQRQIHAAGIVCGDQPEITETCDRLPKTKNIVFAASDEVNTSTDPDRVKKTIQALKKLDAVVYTADTWEAWQGHIEDHSPALLLAIPHNVSTDSGFEALQIATSQNLELNQVKKHVSLSGKPPGPLLFLLGCNTANPSVGYQDFIREMRCAGASVVVGTLTYVLGPQAAPLAEAFVRALWEAQPGSTVGEILPSVRAEMLRADNPMALALVAYGDADWKVG